MPTFALFAFPLFTLALFAALGAPRGLIWATVIGYLFLPEGFSYNPPGLPPYDKVACIAYSLLLATLFFSSAEKRAQNDSDGRDRWLRGILICLAILLVITPFGTWITNTERLVDGPTVRPGLTAYDSLSLLVSVLTKLTPFFLGWLLITRPEHRRELLIAMVVFGLGYTLLVLFELRMSPQINRMVYGYFPHSWQQHIRGGGYRPVVFLRHGLWLGFFLLSITLAALALVKADERNRPAWLIAAGWCFLVLLVSRNLGALLLGLMFVPMILFMTARMQVRVASVITALFLLYPVLAQSGYTPIYAVEKFVERIDASRAASLSYRLENEERHLDRAARKPIFGWGSWGRHRIVDERGNDVSTTDGRWVSVLGMEGWAGYVAFFGLLGIPILFLGRAARRVGSMDPVVAGMAMIMAANFMYLIPNSTLNPIGYLMAGALAAFAVRQGQDAPSGQAEATPTPTPVTPGTIRRGPSYTRFPASTQSGEARASSVR